MASTLEVTATQLADLVAATGQSEEDIRKMFEEMQGKFPSDGLTKEKFLEFFDKADSDSNRGMFIPSKDLFDITDRDHSGKISLYEFVLTTALFGKSDRETVMNSLFKLCDTDHDGFVTQAEITGVWTAIFKAMNKDAKESDPKEMNDELENIKSEVGKAFGGKTKVSPEEFRQFSMENEAIAGLLGGLQICAVMGLGYLMSSFG